MTPTDIFAAILFTIFAAGWVALYFHVERRAERRRQWRLRTRQAVEMSEWVHRHELAAAYGWSAE